MEPAAPAPAAAPVRAVNSPVRRLVSALEAVRGALLTAGRLEGLALVGESTIAAKRARARRMGELIGAAVSLDDHLCLCHGAGDEAVAWPLGASPADAGPVRAGALDLARLDQCVAGWEARAALELRGAAVLAATTPLLETSARLIAAISATLGDRSLHAEPNRAPFSPPKRGARRACSGPDRPGVDPIFRPSFSLLALGLDPTLTGLEHDRAPYYWGLALREIAASELCALCLVEYDGLPVAYYRDFAKQAADELRHGEFFLSVGLSLLPEFVAQAEPGHLLLADARAHLERGTGLPVPLEGGLSGVARDTSLEQRLVLMHLDTETPGVGAFHEQARSPWAQARPWIAEGIEATVHDEAAHARIGRRWLEHLAPDRDERAQVIEQARALRGFFIFGGLAGPNGVGLPELLQRISAGSASGAAAT